MSRCLFGGSLIRFLVIHTRAPRRHLAKQGADGHGERPEQRAPRWAGSSKVLLSRLRPWIVSTPTPVPPFIHLSQGIKWDLGKGRHLLLCVPAQTTASDAGCEGIYPLSAAASGGAVQRGPAAGLVLGAASRKSEYRCVVGQPWLRMGYKSFVLAFTDQGEFGCGV